MELYDRLKGRFPRLRAERNFSFARHTTIGCGGVAAVAATPAEEELAELIAFLRGENIPFCYLGAGANVLPSEQAYEGVVILFSRIRRLLTDGELIYAGAGVTGGALCRFARERSLSGFEPLTGIPMTVGGAVTMNAGVREGHISDLIVRVNAVGERERAFDKRACLFSEKKSIFQSGIAVTGVVFRAVKGDGAEIRARTEEFRRRREHLPKGRSMGCVFVNPEGCSAGRLIEECGLKGLSSGGAYVSRVHANFILNEGGTSDDVGRLIDTVKAEVHRQTGILLREEIRRPFPS